MEMIRANNVIADARGASLPSYGIIVGLLSVVAVVSVLATGEQVASVFSTANNSLSEGGVGLGNRVASGEQDSEPAPEPVPVCSLTGYSATVAPSDNTADTFVYNYTQDSVQSWDWLNMTSSLQDRLILEEIVSPDDVLFININNEDMRLIPENGAQNFIDEQHDDHNRGGFGIIQFCDGTELTRLEIRNKAVSDSLVTGTSNGSEQFDELVYDTSIHSTGTYFSLNISSSIQDALTFTDLDSDEVVMLGRSDSETMIIEVPGGDVLTINDQNDANNRRGVGVMTFADGVSYNRQEIRDRAAADGMLAGTLFGSATKENYVYDSVLHGVVSIDNMDVSSSIDDTLTFSDINDADASFAILNDFESMIITVPGGSVRIDDQHDASNRHGVETVIFADSGPIGRTAMRDRAALDAMSTGTVYGTVVQEDFIYTAAIHGNGFVDNFNNSSSILDTLTFTDLAQSDVSMSMGSDNETLVITVPGGVLTIDDQTDANNRHGVTSMTFTDGTLDRVDIRNKTAADSLLVGGFIESSVKDDVYVYTTTVHGTLTVDNFNVSSSYQDSWTFTDLASTDVVFTQGSDNETLIITLPGGNTVTLDDQTDTSNRHGMNSIAFTDTTLNRAAIIAKIAADA